MKFCKKNDILNYNTANGSENRKSVSYGYKLPILSQLIKKAFDMRFYSVVTVE
ncbi:hypothetical protein GCM10026983_21080 [Gracilibacillus alcaliphilus]